MVYDATERAYGYILYLLVSFRLVWYQAVSDVKMEWFWNRSGKAWMTICARSA